MSLNCKDRLSVGDMVKFIDNEGVEKNDFLKDMTLGKLYKVLNISNSMITVIADNGMESHWFGYRFEKFSK